MATADELDQLRRALSYGAGEVRALADAFYRSKLRSYTATLDALAGQFGVTVDSRPSRAVTAALRRSAMDDARSFVRTYNADLQAFLERWGRSPVGQLLDAFEEWALQRGERRSEIVAVSEAYPPATDALLAFFDAAGVPVEFDFGGHGDAPPACPICKAIEAGNPWTVEHVRQIGTPHINCRQEWHPRADRLQLEGLDVGRIADVAGVIGNDTLYHRAGGQPAAVDFVEQLARTPL